MKIKITQGCRIRLISIKKINFGGEHPCLY